MEHQTQLGFATLIKKNDDFIENLFLETLGRSRDDYLIMAGDWNTVLNYNLDKLGGAAQHANKIIKITSIL